MSNVTSISFLNYKTTVMGGNPKLLLTAKSPESQEIILPEDATFFDILYKKGETVTFNRYKEVSSGTLAKDTVIDHVTYKGGTKIFFSWRYSSRSVEAGTLAETTSLDGIKYKGLTKIFFDPFNKVKKGTLAEDAVVKEIKYLGNTEILMEHSGCEISANLCDYQQTGTLAEEIVFSGYRFKARTVFSFTFGRQMQFNGTLARETKYQGHLFPESSHLYVRDYRISVVKLSQAATIGKILFPANSLLYFKVDGKVEKAILGGNAIIMNYNFSTGDSLDLFSNNNLSFVPKNNISAAKGVEFQAGSRVELDRNGNPLSGTLVKNCLVDGIEYRGNNFFHFYPDGKVFRGMLAKNTIINGLEFTKESYFEFFKDGSTHAGTLAKPVTINQITYDKGEINFNENGTLFEGALKYNTKIDKILYKKGTDINFLAPGKVWSGTLLNNTVIQGVTYKKETEISFYKEGTVLSGTLAKDQSIRGKKYFANQEIVFRENGTIKVNKPYLEQLMEREDDEP